ncbi:hypothetical protein [Corynebacterium kozikiae]|uniref:hypothetical protein n=1 Tax=Corynebacterium kozikiae TaxID=2968469 RepID=UPI00211CD1AF|nr:hypothetical protein [Corynebacterium sp. 76QC2CO]MCQ9343361.1 hypothetical protein [Corynebacterium sp. 76QC2CO]
MSFFEDLANALDTEGIESRVLGETLFVPITPELEIQFVEIDPDLPAANVYIAAANDDDEEFDAALVSVVFSVKDAVSTVAEHVATNQIISLMKTLLEGEDPRLEGLEFFQDAARPNVIRTSLLPDAELAIGIDIEEAVPTATLTFQVFQFDDLPLDLVEEDLFNNSVETLELGTFSDFDKLLDIIEFAASQADSWAEQMVPLDDEFEYFDED